MPPLIARCDARIRAEAKLPSRSDCAPCPNPWACADLHFLGWHAPRLFVELCTCFMTETHRPSGAPTATPRCAAPRRLPLLPSRPLSSTKGFCSFPSMATLWSHRTMANGPSRKLHAPHAGHVTSTGPLDSHAKRERASDRCSRPRTQGPAAIDFRTQSVRVRGVVSNGHAVEQKVHVPHTPPRVGLEHNPIQAAAHRDERRRLWQGPHHRQLMHVNDRCRRGLRGLLLSLSTVCIWMPFFLFRGRVLRRVDARQARFEFHQ